MKLIDWLMSRIFFKLVVIYLRYLIRFAFVFASIVKSLTDQLIYSLEVTIIFNPGGRSIGRFEFDPTFGTSLHFFTRCTKIRARE